MSVSLKFSRCLKLNLFPRPRDFLLAFVVIAPIYVFFHWLCRPSPRKWKPTEFFEYCIRDAKKRDPDFFKRMR